MSSCSVNHSIHSCNHVGLLPNFPAARASARAARMTLYFSLHHRTTIHPDTDLSHACRLPFFVADKSAFHTCLHPSPLSFPSRGRTPGLHTTRSFDASSGNALVRRPAQCMLCLHFIYSAIRSPTRAVPDNPRFHLGTHTFPCTPDSQLPSQAGARTRATGTPRSCTVAIE